MRLLVFLLLGQLLPPAQADTSGFEKLRNSYEQFFQSRYSMEQEFPFRLISVRAQLAEITPHTNVLKPLVWLTTDDFLASDEVKAVLTKSFLPLLYGITVSDGIDTLTLSRQFITRALQLLGSLSQDELRLLLRHTPNGKLSYNLFLAPYRKTDAELFYGSRKISMVRNGTVTLRAPNDVQEHIAQEIDNHRALLFYNYDQRPRLPTPLAARLRFELNEQSAMLRTDVLLHLYPRTLPFVKEEPPVSFRSFIVPSGHKFRFPVALIRLQAPLDSAQPPHMEISFGTFDTIKDMDFVLSTANSHHYMPYLDGSLQKFSPLQVKFRVQKVNLSLASLQADEVRTVFSPGFKLGGLQSADFGRFKIDKIDQKFKTAINKEIASQKDPLIDKVLANPKISKFVSASTAAVIRQLLSGKQTPDKENK